MAEILARQTDLAAGEFVCGMRTDCEAGTARLRWIRNG